jgi:hypothetical protein
MWFSIKSPAVALTNNIQTQPPFEGVFAAYRTSDVDQVNASLDWLSKEACQLRPQIARTACVAGQTL